MISQRKILLDLFVEDKIEKLINQLRSLTEAIPDLHSEVLKVAARFQQNEKQRRLDITENSEVNRENNKIRESLLWIIDHLPYSDVTARINNNALVVIGIFIVGLIALENIGTIKDTLFKKEKIKTVIELPIELKKDELKTNPSIVRRKIEIKKEERPIPSARNNVIITFKDKSSVGTIINGDSNKIDVKQDFK